MTFVFSVVWILLKLLYRRKKRNLTELYQNAMYGDHDFSSFKESKNNSRNIWKKNSLRRLSLVRQSSREMTNVQINIFGAKPDVQEECLSAMLPKIPNRNFLTPQPDSNTILPNIPKFKMKQQCQNLRVDSSGSSANGSSGNLEKRINMLLYDESSPLLSKFVRKRTSHPAFKQSKKNKFKITLKPQLREEPGSAVPISRNQLRPVSQS